MAVSPQTALTLTAQNSHYSLYNVIHADSVGDVLQETAPLTKIGGRCLVVIKVCALCMCTCFMTIKMPVLVGTLYRVISCIYIFFAYIYAYNDKHASFWGVTGQ